MGQVIIPGTVAIVGSLVELLKVTATLLMIALVISCVEETTASLHLVQNMTAAMTPFQVTRICNLLSMLPWHCFRH